MNDDFKTNEQLDYEQMHRHDNDDFYYKHFGDGDPHGWTKGDIERYEEWLMSNDPAIQSDGSYYD